MIPSNTSESTKSIFFILALVLISDNKPTRILKKFIKIKKGDIPCFCLGKIGAQGTKTRINVEVHQMWIINTDLGEKGETGTKSVLSQYTILL